MTQEQTRKAVEVMQAWLNGRKIEFKCEGISTVTENEWTEISRPSWAWEKCEYRVKDEGGNKYRPYIDAEELDTAIQEHGFIIKRKGGDLRLCILTYNDKFVRYSNFGTCNFERLFELFTWLDGSPCGVKIEE